MWGNSTRKRLPEDAPGLDHFILPKKKCRLSLGDVDSEGEEDDKKSSSSASEDLQVIEEGDEASGSCSEGEAESGASEEGEVEL